MNRGIGDGPYLLGETFTAADIMMGFSLVAAQLVGVLDDRFPTLQRYVAKLFERPALQKVAALE